MKANPTTTFDSPLALPLGVEPPPPLRFRGHGREWVETPAGSTVQCNYGSDKFYSVTLLDQYSNRKQVTIRTTSKATVNGKPTVQLRRVSMSSIKLA